MLQSTLMLENHQKCAKYKPVSIFLIDLILVYNTLQSTMMLQNCFKFLCKRKIFLTPVTPVYMIFKYSKLFHFAPSFNKSH